MIASGWPQMAAEAARLVPYVVIRALLPLLSLPRRCRDDRGNSKAAHDAIAINEY